jgi:rhodanese-related sulfurtransferase
MAVLIAITANFLRNDGIAVFGGWSENKRFPSAGDDRLGISLAEAERLFKKDTALFLDARPTEQYMEGHIFRALNLPWQEVDRYFMEISDRLEEADTIITYCDGESCDLSHELALFLKETGFENVRVLANGYTLWQQAGLPIQSGRTP